MWEIIKRADRFSHDEEVIASADSRSEAESLAHDYQVNVYQASAFITCRKAGDKSTDDTVAAKDFEINYHDMTIDGLNGEFVVAKLRRVSSPPVLMGSVSDSMGSALGRLVDIIRLGKESRNFADLTRVEWLLREQFNTTPDYEWAAYEQVVCRVLEVERMEPFLLSRPQLLAHFDLQVTFHKAQMNEMPYLVAQVGEIMGSPAPVYLTQGDERESALARLQDVFKIGKQGQVFQDFLEAGRKLGKKDEVMVREWEDRAQAAR